MKFLRNMLATIVGLFIFSILGFFVFVGWVGIMTAEEKTTIEANSILHLKLNIPIAERSFEDPFDSYAIAAASSIGILDLKEVIDHAKTDDNIDGIYLDLRWIIAGFGHAQELRDALLDFKTSGKFIVAYSDLMSEGSYYIASAADSIYLNPQGDLEFNGIAYSMSFFKGTLDKLDIKPQIFRVGDYKSAVEPFERKDMSEENQEQVMSFIENIYNRILTDISATRHIEMEDLAAISSSMQVQNAQDALDLGLIDGIRYSDEIERILCTLSDTVDCEAPKLVSYSKYRNSFDNIMRSSNRIAVIMASGEIMFGENDQNIIGSEKFVKEIRKARKSDRVKAVVLRINSPGGNFIASDELWREVDLTSQEKPVIASFGNYAASGGYYMGMAADTIVAYPNTITGSIGIFSILFNMSDFLENKLGVTSDVVKTGEFSDIITVSRPLTEYEKSIFQKRADSGYNTFLEKAASGRNMDIEQVKAIASGRVWTGSQALENGLVDVLGNFDVAVEIAAQKANIEDDYKLVFYPTQKSFWEQILSEFGQGVQTRLLKAKAGDLFPYFEVLHKIKSYQGVQARMPYEVNFEF